MYSGLLFALLVAVAIGPLDAVTLPTCIKIGGGLGLPTACAAGSKCCTPLGVCLPTDNKIYETACGTALCTTPNQKGSCVVGTCCSVNLKTLLGMDVGNLNTVNVCLPTCPN